MNMCRLITKGARLLSNSTHPARGIVAKAYLRALGVQYGKDLTLRSRPFCRCHPQATITVGDGVIINNSTAENPAGIDHRTVLVAAAPGARLVIGNCVGVSGATIYCANSIEIEDNVNLGANAKVYDTDFHPINYLERRANTRTTIKTAPIKICRDAWIGADALILKGVTIGARSIVGARSVVTSDVPPDTIVAGSPARVIRHLNP
jgi:acetyltransferase-like isoleucine patch superfamily enzyme